LLVRLAILVLLASSTSAREPDPVPRELHFDRNGYPLPPGAIARLGIPPALTGFAWSLAWTADGKQFVAIDLNGVTVFDAATGRWVEMVPGASGRGTVKNLLVRDGRSLFRLDGNHGSLFDALTGEDIFTFKLPSPLGDPGRSLYSIDLSANHRFLAGIASADSSPGVAWRFDLASHRYTRLVNDRADLQSLRLSPDAKRVFATGGTADPELTARDVVNAKELWTVPLKGIGKLRAISADGRCVAVTDQAGMTVFDAVNGKALMSTPIDSTTPPGMWGVDLSPDGSRLALADDRVVIVWNTTTGKVQHRLAHEARLVAFSPDGKSLLTGSAWIQRWDLATGKEMYAKPFLAKALGVSMLKWSKDGTRLLTNWPRERPGIHAARRADLLGVWDISKSELVWQEGMEGGVVTAQLDPHGNRVRALLNNGTVRGWNTKQPEEPSVALTSLAPLNSHPPERAFLSDGRLVIQTYTFAGVAMEVCDGNGKFEFRRSRSWPETFDRREREFLFRSKEASVMGPDGWRYDLLADHESPRLQGSTSFRLINLLQGHSSAFVAGRTISGSTIGSYVWESLTGGVVTNLPNEIPNLDRAALSPDGQSLAVVADRMVTIHNLRDSDWKWSVPAGNASALAYSPDGSTLATALPDGTVLLWKTPRNAYEWKADASESLWNDLSSADAGLAWKALWHLLDHPTKATELLAAHLQPVPGPKDTAAWILKLDHAKFNVREEAAKTLAGRGESIEGDLREALKAPRSEEQRTRLEHILLKLNPAVPPTGEALRGLRCVWLLERIGTPEAKKVLERLAGGASGSRVTVEAKLVLQRLASFR